KFTSWGGVCSGSGPTCVVGLDAAKTATANFDAVAEVSPPPPPSCATDASLCPKEAPKPTKPLKCKKGFKKQKVKGKLKCRKVKAHGKKGHKKGKRRASRSAHALPTEWTFRFLF